MTLGDAKKILVCFPNLQKVNFGTGETIINPHFKEIISIFEQAGVTLALTTNGLTVSKLGDKELRKFKDVDVSLDFPTKEQHDQWRSATGTFERAIKSLERCSRLKIETSIAIALMNHNYQYLAAFRKIIDNFNICLRINIFKPVQNNDFELNYDQFWKAMKILSENFKLVSASEPILSIVTKTCTEGSPCGWSLRIHPDMTVAGCVYLNPHKAKVEEFIENKTELPQFCLEINCRYLQSCKGGCLGRRILQKRAKLPDMYCPFHNKKPVPQIKFKKAKEKDFVHSSYLCTIIVS